jgi:hypothetical protein
VNGGRWLVAALAVLAGGCSLPGLTSAELFGADAGTSGDAPADAPGGSVGADGQEAAGPCLVEAGATEPANINGTVVDACSRPIGALVGITGQGNSLRTCSMAGKGSWQLLGVKPGCHLTLAAYAPGWKASSADVTVLPGNTNPSFTITLEPQTPAPCDGPAPDQSPCTCAGLPGCQPQ